MYILDHADQESLVESLILVAKADGGWMERYRDPDSGQEWISFQVHGYRQGGGTRILRHEPPPATIEKWMEICFRSDSDDDAYGLAMELSERDDKWPEVVGWLEINRPNLRLPTLKGFIERLGVLHPIDRREVLGKTGEEVAADSERFVDLATRANSLLNSA